MGKIVKNGKLSKLMVVLLAIVVLFSSSAIAFSAKAAAPSDLPTTCIIGYWENWVDGSRLKLKDVDENWDVVIVSFMLTDSTNVKAVFSPDSSLYPGGETAFKEDVKFCQARGQKVLISLGGATGRLSLNSDSDRITFYNAACDIIEKYGFDGIDIDLEASILSVQSGDTLTTTVTPIQGYMNTILHDMVKKFGSDFMVTMAPEHPYVQGGAVAWRGYYGGYMPLINNCRDILTFIHPQYYNNPISEYNGQYWGCPTWGISGYNVASLVKLSELLITGFETKVGFFEGLRPDQVAFGVPVSSSSAGSGYLPISDYQEALRQLMTKYPTIRGIMTWSINKDASNAFVDGMRSVIGTKVQALSLDSIVSNQTGSVSAGSSVTWTASANGGTGSLSYQFQLYKDGILISTQNYSSSSVFNATLTSAGNYTVTATVRDANYTTLSKTSAALTVTQTSASSKEFGMKLNSIYAFVNGSPALTQGYNNDGNGTYYSQMQMVNGRTLLPIRYVAETLGLTVGYDSAANATTVTDGTITMIVPLGSSTMTKVVGSSRTNVDAGADAVLIRNVTHVPVRALLEAFSLNVNWDDAGYLLITDYATTTVQLSELLTRVKAVLG